MIPGMMGEKKGLAAMIVGGAKLKKENSEGGEYPSADKKDYSVGLDSAAGDMFRAIDMKDQKAFMKGMSSFMDIYKTKWDEDAEGPSESEEEFDMEPKTIDK